MSESLPPCCDNPGKIDRSCPALYNEADVRRIATASAEQAISKMLHVLSPGIANLDKCTETGSVSSEDNDGGTEMPNQIKAKMTVNGETLWVTGTSAQKLVDNALKLARKPVNTATPTFEEYATKYVSLYKGNGSLERNTLVGYQSYMNNHILPFFGKMPIDRISSDDIQRYINEKSSSYAQKTIKEHINLLRPIFASAIEDGIIAKNPCLSTRLKVVGQKSQKVLAYTEEEFKQFENLLTRMPDTCKLFLALSLYTGMRQGELFGLRWENIDLNTKLIHVKQSVAWPSQNQGIIKSPKTDHGTRDIIIIPQLMSILQSHHQETGYVLRADKQPADQPMTQQAVKCLKHRLQVFVKANNISVPFLTHRARHTVVTFMNNAGADDVSITGIIGHSDVAFTKRQYANQQTAQLERGMDSFSKYIAGISA